MTAIRTKSSPPRLRIACPALIRLDDLDVAPGLALRPPARPSQLASSVRTFLHSADDAGIDVYKGFDGVVLRLRDVLRELAAHPEPISCRM